MNLPGEIVLASLPKCNSRVLQLTIVITCAGYFYSSCAAIRRIVRNTTEQFERGQIDYWDTSIDITILISFVLLAIGLWRMKEIARILTVVFYYLVLFAAVFVHIGIETATMWSTNVLPIAMQKIASAIPDHLVLQILGKNKARIRTKHPLTKTMTA